MVKNSHDIYPDTGGNSCEGRGARISQGWA